MSSNFYFSFGILKHAPFSNGWIQVIADTKTQACECFQKTFPNPHSKHAIYCDFIYDEKEFQKTNMYKQNDHLGHGCHAILDAKTGETIKPCKIEFDTLAIEVTRDCNMRCPHCLRGDNEKLYMDFETIRPILAMTSSITQLLFTGGEPSLNIPLMNQVLDFVKSHHIPVHGFYLATNGKIMTDEFILCLHKWYQYCSLDTFDEDYIGVALSQDIFHEDIPKEHETALRAFSFFREDKFTDFNQSNIIATGRASNLSSDDFQMWDYPTKDDFTVEEIDEDTLRIPDEFYISANGNIVPGCNLSYEDIDMNPLCNTNDIPSFIKHLKSLA